MTTIQVRKAQDDLEKKLGIEGYAFKGKVEPCPGLAKDLGYVAVKKFELNIEVALFGGRDHQYRYIRHESSGNCDLFGAVDDFVDGHTDDAEAYVKRFFKSQVPNVQVVTKPIRDFEVVNFPVPFERPKRNFSPQLDIVVGKVQYTISGHAFYK